MKISAVVNTTNEDLKYIADCLESLNWVDEIVVVDMESERVKDIAFRYTKHVYNHKLLSYVEPARNFGIKKATGDWILIIDPDERVPHSLAKRLIDITDNNKVNFVRIPRKNMIFGTWIKHSRWWPDYNVRFFKRGKVTWQNEIHSIPFTQGEGITLEEKESLALVHLHYEDIDQYIGKIVRYTNVQSQELISQGYQLDWTDLIIKPTSEFLSRFFAGAGYKDGLHGFAIAGLQSFSEFIVYLKVWQQQGFKPESGTNFINKFILTLAQKSSEFTYWVTTLKLEQTTHKTKRFFLKIKRRINRP